MAWQEPEYLPVLHQMDEERDARGHQRHRKAATSQLFPLGTGETGWELLWSLL